MPRQLPCKPGAERAKRRPDIILSFRAEAPAGLLEFLIQSMPDRKRTTVKDYLKHRQVMVDGVVTTQWDTAVETGSEVRVNTSREFQTFSNPRIKIVYEDDDIIVVNKGYGLLSVGTDSKRDGTAYSILRDYVKRVDPRQKLFIVHRLDQHTSGLMMFAKTAEAKETMQHNWNNMVLERRYVAVVEGGAPDPSEGIVRSRLAENAEHVVYVTADAEAGREAVTEYRTLAARGNYALVELQLATGRKNQIRVHMQQIGHPIAGDRKYGAATAPIRRLALHARTLRFVHPRTRRDMNFSTPVPASFKSLV
ncbi:MAG: RluA family pseudouridine synthase [Muribaculaceae bacterium]|jgi:23S rRNA pseudouridine1911/1915/1917 synthase|nr:RluA family pseudouridine synthase [Muribaculaceae bacterium]